mgnify:CR=1 FL=1
MLRAGSADRADALTQDAGEGRGLPRFGIAGAPIESVIYRVLTSLIEAGLAAAGAFDIIRAVGGSAVLLRLVDLSAARYRSRVLWFC